jgi:hypothetical protein
MTIKLKVGYLVVVCNGHTGFAVMDGDDISVTRDPMPKMFEAGWRRFYAVGETEILTRCFAIRDLDPLAEISVHRPAVFVSEAVPELEHF